MKVFIKETARTKKGYSLYKLAQIMNIPQQTVYSWAAGRTQPNWESMDILCTILECELGELFQVERREGYSEKEVLRRKAISISKQTANYKKMEESLNSK